MKLEITDLKKNFTNGRHHPLPVLDGVNMAASSGEFISIVGPSGCGKSTLLEIIAGLQDKTCGRIMMDSREVQGKPSNCAIVFQQYALFPWLSVQKNIEYGLKIRGVRKTERSETSRRFIGMLGLSGFERYFPHELSGGMQQRVALARALAIHPDILLLDEPFAALDAQTREVCQRELLNLWGQTGVTIIFVTHDVTEAIFLSDRVLVMSKNPGAIRDMVAIDLKRPRDFGVRLSSQFRDMEYWVRTCLYESGAIIPSPDDPRSRAAAAGGYLHKGFLNDAPIEAVNDDP